MKNDDLISLIVPVYKVEPYLDRCVESLVRQSYDNIEILLIDDGSPDRSGAMADAWAERDSRIRVFHKENGGLSSARNYGIREARGAYIGFVDSDDYVSVRFVETLYSLLCRYDAQIAAVGCTKTAAETAAEPEIDLSLTEVYDRPAALRNLFAEDKYLDYAPNKLYLRELFEGIEYPEGRLMEDMGTTYRLIACCDSMAFNPAGLYFYYQREGSILSAPKSLKFMTDKYAMSKGRYVFTKEHYPDMEENYRFFFPNSLLLFPYQSESEQRWIREELQKTYPCVRSSLGLKNRVKYRFCLLLPGLYEKMCRTKNGL